MERKFKVGDRVRYTGAEECLSPECIGKTGTITKSGRACDVRWDDPNIRQLGVFDGNLELIVSDARKAYDKACELLKEAGQPAPAPFMEPLDAETQAAEDYYASNGFRPGTMKAFRAGAAWQREQS